jgi:acyl dehydratase
MTVFESVDALLKAVEAGENLGVTQWQTIDQARVDAFADITGDHGWIHVDPLRARADGPFGGTIAHGALTLSLCVSFLCELLQVEGVRLVVNAGLNRVRFKTPVAVGSRVRGTAVPLSARMTDAGLHLVTRITAHVEGVRAPACIADQVVLLYP